MSYPYQAKTEELYSLYKRCYPTPGIHETYQYLSSGTNEAEPPLSLSEARALLADSITILTTDNGNAPHLSEQVATPLILLIDASAQLNRSELSNLKNAVYETDRYQLWYSDHDYRDADNAAVYPCYKPAWNPGLLRHGNYVGAAVLCQTGLFIRSGGIHRLAGQSIIYDFLLRCCSLLSRDQIKHIPCMLYHLPSSHYQHPHGFFAQTDDRLALERDVKRNSATQDVIDNGPFPGTFTIRRHLRGNVPSVNIVIPTKNHRHLLESCVSSVISVTEYPDFSITIVDNGSTDSAVVEYLAELHKEPCISKIDYANDFNFSAINNLAVNDSEAEVIVLLNDDIEVTQKDWLKNMVAEAIQPDVACVGTKLFYANGLVQHAGVVAGMQGVAGHINRFATPDDRGYAGSLAFSSDYSAVTAACLAVRRSVYVELDGLDAIHLAVAYNDVDFCLRALEAGYRNRLLADVHHVHHESVSRGHATDRVQQQRFLSEIAYMKKRHAAVIEQDPAWNPNFSKRCSSPFVPFHAGYEYEAGRQTPCRSSSSN
ncbi:MAG: glycosyltransferase [Granulosicoccus sp.]